MSALSMIEIFAGLRPDGSKVMERLQVRVNPDQSCELVRAPAFVQGLASGDRIKIDPESRSFELVQRAGNLCIRVFARSDIEQLAEDLTPPLEKLGASLDFANARMLVYSIHVSCGFAAIEKILDDLVGEETDSSWLYGNVYDPRDGVTPLNWWQAILAEQ